MAITHIEYAGPCVLDGDAAANAGLGAYLTNNRRAIVAARDKQWRDILVSMLAYDGLHHTKLKEVVDIESRRDPPATIPQLGRLLDLAESRLPLNERRKKGPNNNNPNNNNNNTNPNASKGKGRGKNGNGRGGGGQQVQAMGGNQQQPTADSANAAYSSKGRGKPAATDDSRSNNRRFGRCFNCNDTGHFAVDCPKPRRNPQRQSASACNDDADEDHSAKLESLESFPRADTFALADLANDLNL
jgi:hypothetical protein